MQASQSLSKVEQKLSELRNGRVLHLAIQASTQAGCNAVLVLCGEDAYKQVVFRVHAEILRISEALPDLIQADAVLEVTGQAQAVVIRSIESVVKVPGVRKQIWHAWRHTCRQLQVCRDSAEVAQILAPGKP